MSLSTTSSTGSPYAAVNSGCARRRGVLQAIEAVPGKIVDGVEDVGEAVGEAASATVSFSARAMQALANGGMAVVHGVEDVIAFPFEMAADAAIGAEHAVEGGIHLLASGVHAAINGVEAVGARRGECGACGGGGPAGGDRLGRVRRDEGRARRRDDRGRRGGGRGGADRHVADQDDQLLIL